MMMSIQHILERFEQSPKWTVYPPTGMPKPSEDFLAPKVKIPDEILYFYKLWGGLKSVIEVDEDLILSVVPPQEFSWAVRKLLGNTLEKQLSAQKEDRAWYWYVIGQGDTDEYFVIDLAPERYGHCYFSKFYFFEQPGWTPVVATSFSGFLHNLYEASLVGETWSWQKLALGDAYD